MSPLLLVMIVVVLTDGKKAHGDLRRRARAGNGFAVASNGSIRSSVPCITSTGTSIFCRSPRKSVSQVSRQAYGMGRGAGRNVEARLPGLVADPLGRELVDVVEVVEDVLEVRVAVFDDRSLDALEDPVRRRPRGCRRS